MSSTFSGFYIAKRGIRTARANLQVTGQNMTNVNTKGYTKQNVDSYALSPTDSNMRIAGPGLQIGNGVESTGVSQSRDPYLDILYRQKNAVVEDTNTSKNTLTNVLNALDETVNTGITKQISSFKDALYKFNNYSNSDSNSAATIESTVKGAATTLANTFYNAAKSLSTIRSQTLESFNTEAISKTNNLLKNIASLNEEIKSADISGSPALELRDQRNSMIDELSKYANIKVSSTDVSVGATSVSTLQIDLVSDNKEFNLVDNSTYNQFTLDSSGSKFNLKLQTTEATPKDVLYDSNPADSVAGVAITNDDYISGQFNGYLTMLNDNGEYDSPATTRGIGYYQKVLDTLANDFATTLNKLNSTDTAGTNKPLFESSDTSNTTIDALNISVAKKWDNATGLYLTTTKTSGTTGTGTSTGQTDRTNTLAMYNKLSETKIYDTNGDGTGAVLFSSSIDTFMSTVTNSKLAVQVDDITTQNSTANTELTSIDTERQSVSSVDINDEGINLMMYNQALSASSRFMTTMNDMLDTIINNMGVV